MSSILLSGCGGSGDSPTDDSAHPEATIQRHFKLVERWSSRWCADQDWERLDNCQGSQNINELMGSVQALAGRSAAPPMAMDTASATTACLDANGDAIAHLDALLENGARVVVWGEQICRYRARTQPDDGKKDYHLIFCEYRDIILEGPQGVLGNQLTLRTIRSRLDACRCPAEACIHNSETANS